MTWFAFIVALAITGILRGFPRSSLARMLHTYLAEWPVNALTKLKRHHLLLIGLSILVGLFGLEIVGLFGMDALLAFTSLDLSLYLDAIFVAAALRAVGRLRTFTQRKRPGERRLNHRSPSRLRRLSRLRAAGSHRKAQTPPANDEERHWPFADRLSA